MATKLLTPENLNWFKQSEFKLLFDRLPHVEFFCQRIGLPGLTLGQSNNFGTPFSAIKVQGDHLDFQNFSIEFIVDEDYKNYLEIFDWMYKLGFPEKYSDFSNLKNETVGEVKLSKLSDRAHLKSNAIVMLMTNKSNANLEVKFTECWPVSLGQLDLTTTEEPTPILATVEFAYDIYNIKPVGTELTA